MTAEIQRPPIPYSAIADSKFYFEDIEVGLTRDCGEVVVEEEEMLDFAERYDFQPIYVDKEASRNSLFGDLIASGWLTAALSARLPVSGFMNQTENQDDAVLTMVGLGLIEKRSPD